MHAVLSLFAMLIKHMLCWTVMSSFYRYYIVAAVLWPLQCLTQNQYNDDCPPDQNKTKFFHGRANFYSPLDLRAQTDLTRQNVGFGGADVLNAIGLKTKPEYEVRTSLHGYLDVHHNLIVQRALFNKLHQLADESVDTFIQDLYRLAEDCEYGLLNGSLIWDQIVIGVVDDSSDCLQAKADLTLKMAVQMSRQAEGQKQNKDLVWGNAISRGFIKSQGPGKLTGCERDLAIDLLSFIRKTKIAPLKNPTDLMHKNLMKTLYLWNCYCLYTCGFSGTSQKRFEISHQTQLRGTVKVWT